MTRKLFLSLILVVLPLAANAIGAPPTHPDGNSLTYRGWGPSNGDEDGYECTLYGPAGDVVGTISFTATGTAHLVLPGREANFQIAAYGYNELHPLDAEAMANFPILSTVPDEYKQAGNQILVFAGRYEAGTNLFLIEPVTPFASEINTIEARCIYILDSNGNVIFCLNCVFVIS